VASVTVQGIRKTYPSNSGEQSSPVEVLADLSLNVADGEFVSFFGPNGCGKTTFLNLVGGLLEPDSGTIEIHPAGSGEARAGFIFQNYRDSLYPWLKNIDNVAFPLELQGIPKKERRLRAARLLEKLGIEIPHFAYPYELSGGQQQLLAIARALIFDVDVVLMDEPFASLDYSTRFYVRDRVHDIWMRTRTTTLFVSHSIDEAIYLADRLVLFSRKPMRILEQIPIVLPRPRRPEMLEEESFFQMQARALHLFNEEMKR
jgi:NitT/TauT family transport system ATP-binding protein